MAKPNSQPGANILPLSQKVYRSDKNGKFKVPYKVLLQEDLSVAVKGTIVNISYNYNHGSVADAPRLASIQVLDLNQVLVYAGYFRCPCCWGHALSFKKFTDAVEKLFDHENAVNPKFRLLPMGFNEKGEPTHVFAIEIANGYFVSIEAQVNAAVEAILKPLLDTRDVLDAQILQQFGV
jgi:hypothetical protein